MATIVNVTKSGRKTPIFTLAKGDARTKRVQFVVPRDDAEVPLDELTWRIVIKNAVGEQDGTALQKEVHGDHIDLWWTCGYIAANAVGLTTIYLNAFNEDGKMQWSSGEYCIHVIPAKEDEQEEGNGLSELQELIESARQAMENATQETIAATQSAIAAAGSANEAANTAEKAAENAEDAAGGANDSAIRADEAAESADKAKEDANEAAENAQRAANNANTAANAANTAAQAADNARLAISDELNQLSEDIGNIAKFYNLYDRASVIKGKTLTSSTGVVTDSENESLGRVKIVGGERYRINLSSAPMSVWFYTNNGTPIDNQANLRVWSAEGGHFFVDAPENAAIVMWPEPVSVSMPYICLYSDYVNVKSGQSGEIAMDVPVGKLVGTININNNTDFPNYYGVFNRLDPAAITEQTYWPPTASASSPNTTYYLTDYIAVKPGETLYLLDVNMQKNYMRYVKAFDENKTPIGNQYGADSVDEYMVPNGVGYIRVTILNKLRPDSVMLVHENPGELLAYGDYRISKARLVGVSSTIHAYMPPEVCVAVGRTIELYNNQVCLEADKYHVRWVCDVGAALGRKYTVTATDSMVGDHTLRCEVINDSNAVVWNGSTKLKIVRAIGNAKTICPIGDSLTSWKAWTPEVMNLSNGMITFVGTRTHSLEDADGEMRTFGHEGRSGFSAKSYITGAPYTYGGANETPHNRFWDGEKFSWSHYKSTYGIKPDAVQIFLGTNGISYDATENAGYIKQMVDAIRADDANIPIFVVNTIYRSRQDGYGSVGDDGYVATNGASAYQFGEDIKVHNLMIKLVELLGDYDGVHHVPLALCHDTDYNFGAVTVPVNPRAEQKQEMPEESVHPSTQGYFQFADVFYSAYCGALGE